MAALSLNYLQIGPRQGVHIGHVRWRQSQFRAPEASYQFRARVEPHTATTGAGFPARIVQRQVPSRSNPSPTSPKKCPQLLHRQPSERGKEGLKFSLTAQAVVMKPRPPQRPLSARSSANSVPTSQQPFSYPDPATIKGNVAFDLRLIELAKLESDTVKYEEFRSRMLSRSNRPSSPNDRFLTRPSSAKSALLPKARPQFSPKVSLGGERKLGTAPLLNRKTSCPAVLSNSINCRSCSRPASLYGTIRESRGATPTTQRAVSRSHWSPSKHDRTSTCTLNPSNRQQRPSCSPDTESKKSESLGLPSKIPATNFSDDTPLQNENTVATQTTSTNCTTQSQSTDSPSVVVTECSSLQPLSSQADLKNHTELNSKAFDHLAACWKLTDGQSYSPNITAAETVCENEGNVCVHSITDLDLLPGQKEGVSSSSQKRAETNERATQTTASTSTKRKGSKSHCSRKIPLSRSHSSPRLDNQLPDSSSECSLKSTKFKQNRSPTSRKLHNTHHAPRRTK